MNDDDIISIIKAKSPKNEWERIGGGAQGELFKFTMNDGMYYVAKTALKGEDELKIESTLLEKLKGVGNGQCKNYLQCFVKALSVDNKYWLISGFIPGRPLLEEILETKNKYLSHSIIEQLVEGLKTLHESGIAHMDIKPENIMFDKKTNTIKYIDLGLSCLNGKFTCKSCGSLMYVPPEIMDKEKFTFEEAQKIDMWELGVTIFAWYTGKRFYDVPDKLLPLTQTGWRPYVLTSMICKTDIINQISEEYKFDMRNLLNMGS